MTTTFMNERVFPYFFTNPIQILHRLKEAGFTEKQAEVQVEIATECYNECFKNIEATIATKRDLKELELKFENSLKKELRELELKFELRFQEIESKFKELEMKLTIKMGAITGAIVGFFYLLEKFF